MSITSLQRALLAGALSIGLCAGAITNAEAASTQVSDVTLSWGLNQESGSGAYMGGCNFLVAGKVGNAGSSHVWTAEEGFYAATAGNVAILKDGPGGPVEPTFATKCQDASGVPVRPAVGSSTNNRAVLSSGTGTVDVAAGTASIAWDGAFTAVFYGGLSYWSAEDLELSVAADGTGTLIGTVSAYAASMTDPDQWDPVPSQRVALAKLSGVEVTATGIVVNPDYLGVALASVAGQVTTGASWGSFPEEFVAFHVATGQASYWYSSGGSADPKKVAAPLSVAWQADDDTSPEPQPGDSQGDVEVSVEVPEATEPEPGVLKLSVSGAATLGQATASTDGFSANGALPQVTISDSRASGTWAVNGQLGDFTSSAGSIPAAALGWTPAFVSGTAIQVGASVTPNSPGLGVSSTLASGGRGESVVGAALALAAPANTAAGSYTAKLTLTAVG